MVYDFPENQEPELLGNPIIGAVIAGGVSLAGLIVGRVAAKRQQRRAIASETRTAAAITAQAEADKARATAATKTSFNYAAMIGLPLAAVGAILFLKNR